MKTAALRTLSLTLVFTVVIGVCLRHRVVTAAPAGGAVTAGEFLVDPPTLINLGFEWFIEGDDNRNASVDVSYRKQGTTDWKQALPLLRLQGERIKQGDQLDVISPNMFAGSILDLEPNTAYEARFVLRDPDGVSGQATKTVTVRTRPEPMPAAGGNVYHVYPPGYQRREDRAVVRRPDVRVQPHLRRHRLGDGRPSAREGRRHHPRACRPLQIQPLRIHERSGRQSHDAARRHVLPDRRRARAEKPIVIKGAGDGEAIFDGAGNFALFDVQAADYNYFEGLTFRNTDYAILGRHAVHRRRQRA